MKWGVTWDAFKFNFIGTVAFSGFILGSPVGLLGGVLIHFILKELCRHSPHFFHKWKLWLVTKAKSGTSHLWGASRLQPTPGRTGKACDMMISI